MGGAEEASPIADAAAPRLSRVIGDGVPSSGDQPLAARVNCRNLFLRRQIRQEKHTDGGCRGGFRGGAGKYFIVPLFRFLTMDRPLGVLTIEWFIGELGYDEACSAGMGVLPVCQ